MDQEKKKKIIIASVSAAVIAAVILAAVLIVIHNNRPGGGDPTEPQTTDAPTDATECEHSHLRYEAIADPEGGESMEHIIICEDCGEVVGREPHDYPEGSDVCSKCGYHRNNQKPGDVYGYESLGNGKHRKFSKDPDSDFEPVVENCVFDENGKCILCGYQKEHVHVVTGIQLSAGSATLNPGQTKQLYVKALPDKAALSPSTLKWESQNTEVVTVKNGKLTAVAEGTANVTASYTKEGKTFTAQCKVTVQRPAPEEITLEQKTLTLAVGETEKLTVLPVPGDAAFQTENLTWKASSDAVTVSNGTVTAVSKGTATVTAVYTLDGKQLTAECTVTVIPAPFTGIVLDRPAAEITVGSRLQLHVTAVPGNEKLDESTLTWESSSDAVTVDNGEIRGVKAGTATVTVTYIRENQKLTAACQVQVKEIRVVDENTLFAAVNHARPGRKIPVEQDITLNSNLIIPKNLTLDLQNHTLTVSGNIAIEGNVTISGGKIVKEKEGTAILVRSGELNLEKTQISVLQDEAIRVNQGGKLNISEGSVLSAAVNYPVIQAVGADIRLKNVTIDAKSDSGLLVSLNSRLTVEGGTITARKDVVLAESADVILNDVKIVSSDRGVVAVRSHAASAAAESHVTINGGSIQAGGEAVFVMESAVSADSSGLGRLQITSSSNSGRAVVYASNAAVTLKNADLQALKNNQNISVCGIRGDDNARLNLENVNIISEHYYGIDMTQSTQLEMTGGRIDAPGASAIHAEGCNAAGDMNKVHIRNTVIVTENTDGSPAVYLADAEVRLTDITVEAGQTDGRGIQLTRCQNAVISGGSVTADAACICTESSTVTLEEKPLLICRAVPDTPIQGDGITGEYRTEK